MVEGFAEGGQDVEANRIAGVKLDDEIGLGWVVGKEVAELFGVDEAEADVVVGEVCLVVAFGVDLDGLLEVLFGLS